MSTPAFRRSFSSTCPTPSRVLSPLNKTVLTRTRRRANSPLTPSTDASTSTVLPLATAATLLSSLSPHTPSAAYELTINLRPSPTLQLNALRGRLFLPHASSSPNKSPRLYLFAPSALHSFCSSLPGVTRVGAEELFEELSSGKLGPGEIDKLLTTKEMLRGFGKVARLLGPRGLMPSEKRGTVCGSTESELRKAVREALGGTDWKGDQRGVVRAAVGRLHLTPDQLAENINTMLASVSDVAMGGTGEVRGEASRATKRPGVTRVLLSSTQGPGIVLSDV